MEGELKTEKNPSRTGNNQEVNTHDNISNGQIDNKKGVNSSPHEIGQTPVNYHGVGDQRQQAHCPNGAPQDEIRHEIVTGTEMVQSRMTVGQMGAEGAAKARVRCVQRGQGD